MESPGRSFADDNRARSPELQALLQKTSRTFALTIPLLPEPLQTEVATAYLLFRIIDTFEDAARWEATRRTEALSLFIALMEGEARDVDGSVAKWLVSPPLDHAGYLELLAATPRVIAWHRGLRPAASELVRKHLIRSARGMISIVERTDASGVLQMQTLQDLRDYCFIVAGIVGEMLTELFILQSPPLKLVSGELRARAVEFGEALQLVNILKDARPDADEGRVYLPRDASLPEVFQLARADLRRATEYIDLLQKSGAAKGTVAFNALNTRLAIATLRLLRDQGPGAKLTRLQVTGIAAQVMHAVETGGVLFPEMA
ncbi:MAG TPA: squalene/phytoene synthase family protein [Polyangia bacterium]|jgi:farnesyl-diphosphate farnesyltransferase|nr:squalene/phytoene synthase family protein [Polyangia bacterium]